MKIAYVEWLDAAFIPGYLDDAPDLDPMPCVSCGFLVKSDKKAVVIATDIFGNERGRGGTIIPRAYITKMKILESNMAKKKKSKRGGWC
jgi:hypothetical protein